MSIRRRLARRLVLAALSWYLVMTVVFAFVALTADPNIGSVRFAAAMGCEGPPEIRSACIAEHIQAYRASHNLDEELLSRYVRWLGNVSTFRWGRSFQSGAPVVDVILSRLPYTLMYVVPSMVISAVGGVVAGAYLALHGHERVDRLGTALTYGALGVPNFWLATVLLLLLTEQHQVLEAEVDATKGLFAPATLEVMLLPTLVLSTTLFAGQFRHARAQTLEHVGQEFVRLIRAKGFADYGVGRRIVRVAAAPLLSLFFVDLLGVLVVNVYVIEFVFEIPGFGLLSYDAIKARDLPLVMGTAMAVALFGIAGNAVQDLAHTVLDPRVGADND